MVYKYDLSHILVYPTENGSTRVVKENIANAKETEHLIAENETAV